MTVYMQEVSSLKLPGLPDCSLTNHAAKHVHGNRNVPALGHERVLMAVMAKPVNSGAHRGPWLARSPSWGGDEAGDRVRSARGRLSSASALRQRKMSCLERY